MNALNRVVLLNLILSTGMFIHAGALGWLEEPRTPVGLIRRDPTSLFKEYPVFFLSQCDCLFLQKTNASKNYFNLHNKDALEKYWH